MKRTAFSTFCLTLILSIQGWTQGQSVISSRDTGKADSRFSAEWRLRLSGTDFRDEQSQSKVVDIRGEFKAKYILNSSLQLDIQPIVRMQSGQTQSLDGADKPENKITLSQAAAHYLPFQSLKLSAGALNQKYVHNEILMDNIAFPAARAEGLIKSGDFKTGVILETAIPTSTSLSTNTKELEATPSLNSAALKFQWKNSKESYIKASAGYFAYANLPSAVAQQSGLLGNEIHKVSEAQYSFINDYQGLEASTEFSTPMTSSATLNLGAEYILNQKAKAEQNTGVRYFLAGEFKMTSNLTWGLGTSYFSIAPDAAVAYFGSRVFETNRIGYSADTSLSFNKEGFLVGLKYVDTEVMYTNSVQSREKTLFIKLETFYADL